MRVGDTDPDPDGAGGFGTGTLLWHFGHFEFLPAAEAGARSRSRQPGHW
jgi:hypothetical protein